uniref:Uncharacterized protein n=1 Tax=Magallana gigas TaxID=29159 RepID=A0A8W8MJU8_MAGGI
MGTFRNWPQNTILKNLKVFNHDNSLCFDCQEYELRQYSASSWMPTNTAGVDYSKASNFMRLFRYISGTNTDKMKIAMTASVMTMITPGQGPACENNFTMSFFMSPEVKTPPTPTEKGVFPKDMPKMNINVRWTRNNKHLRPAMLDS